MSCEHKERNQMNSYIQSGNEQIFVHQQDGSGIGVVYLSGHRNVIEGNPKTKELSAFCKARAMPFLTFDYAGWGQSGNSDHREWAVDAWIRNAIDVVDCCVNFPAILVGYSMGGYIMLMTALARPQKICGLLGIAPGFGEYIQQTNRKDIGYEPDNLTINLALDECDGATFHKITNPLDIRCPVHCVHGLGDDLVNWRCSLNLIQQTASPLATVELLKGGNHQMSRTTDMNAILNGIQRIL